MASLYETYKKEIVPALKNEFNYKSVMAVPKIAKIVVNVGLGQAVNEKNLINTVEKELVQIVGQKPLKTRAKKSIAGFKLREGQEIGLKVTLRGKKMYDFLTKLTQVALPRVKDFEGIPANSFDGRGNYTLGLKEHIIFPEINYEKVEKIIGMDITIVTSAEKDEEAKRLLVLLGMPFRK
ncbi:MAG TPA: 50S ribosomal protein L5 [Spirochaetia bacterium]|nr:MAG: 50S ribosomal protein L5 [Spirochaetes bacterium GWB1_36_13]HCL57328.1 50S ribosomal protein L5 [Spirochaetia bacterium]